MTNQNNFKPGQNHGTKTGRSANERGGENDRGSQNKSDHRSTERDSRNAADRNLEKNKHIKQAAAAATEKNSGSANRIGNRNDSDAFKNNGNRTAKKARVTPGGN